SPRHARPADPQDRRARPRARLRDCATAPADLTRRSTGPRRVSLSGVAPPGNAQTPGGGVAADPVRARRQGLPPGAPRPRAARSGNGKLESPVGNDRADPGHGGRRRAMNWRRWLRRDDREANLERELSFHIEERVADMVRSGVSEENARRQVRLEFGAA